MSSSESEREKSRHDPEQPVKYTEDELKELQENFIMFDVDGGGGLGAKGLEKCKENIFLS